FAGAFVGGEPTPDAGFATAGEGALGLDGASAADAYGGVAAGVVTWSGEEQVGVHAGAGGVVEPVVAAHHAPPSDSGVPKARARSHRHMSARVMRVVTTTCGPVQSVTPTRRMAHQR